jgi:hypothetical protein
MADWVLSGFHGQDAADMADAAKRAADAVECYIQNGPGQGHEIQLTFFDGGCSRRQKLICKEAAP